jgi:hypothetical protein
LVNVLIEDFTAHHCPNCPAQSVLCEAITKGANGNQAIFVEENISELAQPYGVGAWGVGAIDSAYMVNYRNPADSEYNLAFINGDVNAMPGTMVNRVHYTNPTNIGSADLFLNGITASSIFDSIMTTAAPQSVNIHIVDSMYAPPTNTLSMSITTKLIAPVAGTKYYLVAMLVEDSIFDWQDSMNVDRKYYLKRMTLRGNINNGGFAWGDLLSDTAVAQTKHYTFASSNFVFNTSAPNPSHPQVVHPTSWNMAHMFIVAFVYQIASTGEHNYLILQAQRVRI